MEVHSMMYAHMPQRLRRSSFATSKIFLTALFLAVLVLAVITFTSPSNAQQPAQAQQTDQATGVSNPPDIQVQDSNDPADIPETAQPSASSLNPTPAPQPESAQPAAATPSAQPAPVPQPAAQNSIQNQDPDGMIVGDMPATAAVQTSQTDVQPAQAPAQIPAQQNPQLEQRTANYSADPDSDIVKPRIAQPGEILEGTIIRIRLIDRLSSAQAVRGTVFKGRVASDVLSNGQVLIPTGSEIDGQVIQVSSGDHLGASGSMRLRPEILILPDGSSYRITSVVTGAPGSGDKVNDEGTIKAGSRMRRDEFEYGGVVTGGVVTGAILGGPVGALTGGAVGAGVVTTHLLVSHPQAVLEPNTVLLITLTQPLHINSTPEPLAQSTSPAAQN